MRAFTCGNCRQLVFFENTVCLRCGARLAFDWPTRELLAFPERDTQLRCANAGMAGCNWLARGPGKLCASCRLTRTRPGDHDVRGLAALPVAEAAKRRLLFALGELGLPVDGFHDHPDGLAFDLLSSEHVGVTTGHDNGVITLDLAESDHAHRERMRERLGEPYRTVLGHLRHEIGHYYWPLLTPDDERRERSRAAFGDEREDYRAALDRHYANGAPVDWRKRFVSAYATMHPAEDWAETFAHYLHVRDTLQTAGAYGVEVRGPSIAGAQPDPALVSVPGAAGAEMRSLLDAWLPLTYALNAINRAMGSDDLYPFVLPGPVVAKLELVHELVGAADRRDAPVAGTQGA